MKSMHDNFSVIMVHNSLINHCSLGVKLTHLTNFQ